MEIKKKTKCKYAVKQKKKSLKHVLNRKIEGRRVSFFEKEFESTKKRNQQKIKENQQFCRGVIISTTFT